MTDPGPTLEELMVGVGGLALLRTLYADAADARAARLAETRALLDGTPRTEHLGAELDLTEGYVRWAPTYDRPLRLFGIEEPPLRRLLDDLPAGEALDAACGTGRWAAHLADRGHTVVGVDQSPAMLDRARTKLPDARFLEGQLTALPLPDASVDAAVCALALVHVADLATAIGELARVVRPGGRIVVSDVHPFLVMLGWQAQFPTDQCRAFMRLHAHLPSDYTTAALDAGLTVRAHAEPCLSAEAVATPTADLIPDANRAAYVGLPGVIVWEFGR
ncbi:class I SAM-dependent methyltransferase [Actinomycetospora straminea]|uniref:class I SAM-dependent methyltransferase n=1 Tax=Actinomycetospora straminea TaxID=663607 RepID=UPI002365F6B4|nr:class I SAM-dependent methyltransferase [Actinomycetospora straminea]MDD7933123.1 class I SAM-dependent methyltransferase [Actinomycetospora straminea]